MGFSKSVIRRYKKLIEENKSLPRVIERKKLNIDTPRKDLRIDEEIFWEKLVMGIVTSNVRNNAAFRKKLKDSNILKYEVVKKELKDREGIAERLKEYKIGRYQRNSTALMTNMERLDNNWQETERRLKTLQYDTTLEKERKVAKYLADLYLQIGPKQSRNIIQMLGLSRYVVPLDSRMDETINEYGGIVLPEVQNPYSRENYYMDIEDQINDLCVELYIYPCFFDACVYWSKDDE